MGQAPLLCWDCVRLESRCRIRLFQIAFDDDVVPCCRRFLRCT